MTIEATEHDHFLRTAPFDAIVADAKAKAPKPIPTLRDTLEGFARFAVQIEDDRVAQFLIAEVIRSVCKHLTAESAELWWGELRCWVDARDTEELGQVRPADHDGIDYAERITEALDELTGATS